MGNGSNDSGLPFVATKNGSGPPSGDAPSLNRPPYGGIDYTKVLLLGVAYSGVIVAAHWLAYLIRFEFHVPASYQTFFWWTLRWLLPLELGFLVVFGQFRSLLSYFSLPDARRVVFASAATSLIAMAIWYVTGGAHAPPRSIIILSFLLDTAGLINVRVLFRISRERQRGNGKDGRKPRRIVIVGAGDVGANLAKEMKLRRDLCMVPVAFFDDDRRKWNTYIHGVRVVGRPELLSDSRIRADEAVIAMPSASGKRVHEVVQVFNEARLKFEIVPSMEQMVNGNVKVSQIRPVQIEDLLGREPVCLETERISELVLGKVVMVTGAGGSIGSELCRQIAGYHPLRLVLVERCEVQIFPIEQELLALRGTGVSPVSEGYAPDMGRMPMPRGTEIIPLVADILDSERMSAIFERFRPQIVFHAAAHKHVPMMEHQPYEAFRNNTIGTKKLAKLAAQFAVERFVLISTDKAINPTNVMGATKRLAELYIQALQRDLRRKAQGAESKAENREIRKARTAEDKSGNLEVGKAETTQNADGIGLATDARGHLPAAEPTVSAEPKLTRFMAVRFGNVLDSSGSVIPTFKKQIAAGGPVTVTHPDITRYFMTIPEAVGLVLQSATQGEGGEIFVLDMGKSVKILELARQLIELSGLRPGIDVDIKFTGLRPGEKLFEELNHNTENTIATSHPKIMRFVGEPLPFETLRQGLVKVHEKAASMDANQVKLEIQKLVPEYRPYLTST